MPYAAPTHKQQRPLFLKREDRQRYDESRGTSAERGYGHAWRRSREGFLRRFPLCAICLQRGRYEPATDCHHRMKVVDHPDLFWNDDYWQALCHSCHSKLTALGQ